MKDLNEVAKSITLDEGSKVSISIAQVKEVIKLISIMCYEHPEVISMLIANGGKKRKIK